MSGNVCTKLNDYYSQCLPGAATSQAPPPPPPVTSAPATSAPVTTAPPAGSTSAPAAPGSCPAVASTIPSFSDAKLPNPFTFNDGTPVKTKSDFTCRQQQILALVEGYEAGALPGKPQSVTGSFSGSTLTVNVQDNGKSMSFTASITFPSGTAPAAGWPLVIAYEGGSIPIPAGVSRALHASDDCIVLTRLE